MSGWDGDKNAYLNRMRDGKQQIAVRQFKVDACCERCTFGRGPHAEWCASFERPTQYAAGGDDGPGYSIGMAVKF